MWKATTEQSVLERVKKTASGCWKWQGYKTKRGYGTVGFKYKPIRVHRLMWIFRNGDIPKGLLVCHTCDNPPCCNPDHLFIGTQQDNVNDRGSKGRLCKIQDGSLNDMAKL